MKKSKITLVLSIALLPTLGSCFWQLLDSQIILVNQTSSTINTVQVEVSNQKFEARDIPPGKSYSWRFTPDTDSLFKVTGRLSTGETISSPPLGYTTPGDKLAHNLFVKKGGTVVYRLSRKKMIL